MPSIMVKLVEPKQASNLRLTVASDCTSVSCKLYSIQSIQICIEIRMHIHTHAHTHTHTRIFHPIHSNLYMCVCVCVCMCVRMSVCLCLCLWVQIHDRFRPQTLTYLPKLMHLQRERHVHYTNSRVLLTEGRGRGGGRERDRK